VAENFGGPVWHASGKGRNERESLRLCQLALSGVGDRSLGEWTDREGTGRGIVHVQRRLTEAERQAFAVPQPYDIRGSAEEQRRLAVVYAEAPYLRALFA
jgi:hypothetical protein